MYGLHYEPWPSFQNDLKMHQAPTWRAPSECHLPHQPLGKIPPWDTQVCGHQDKLKIWSQRVWPVFGLAGVFNDHSLKRSRKNPLKTLLISTSKGMGLWSDTTTHHDPFKHWMVCIVSLELLVKVILKCIKHQPDGLLQSAIFLTNLWKKISLRYSSVWSPL